MLLEFTRARPQKRLLVYVVMRIGENMSDQSPLNPHDPAVNSAGEPGATAVIPAISASGESHAQAAMQALEEKRTKRKRTRRTKIIIAVVLALVFLIGVGAWFGYKAFSNKLAKQTPTVQVERMDFEKKLTNSGTLQPIRSQTVTPTATGVVTEVNVVAGQSVNEGDKLFTISSPEVDTALRNAEIGVKQAKQGVAQAQRSYNDAVEAYHAGERAAIRSYNNAVNEYNAALAKGIDPGKRPPAYEDSQFAFDGSSAQSAINAAADGITSAKLQLEQANAALEEAQKAEDALTITAPISGQILSLNIESGTNLRVLAEQGKAPLQIADVSQMYVDVPVGEVDVLAISEGIPAQVTFDAIPDLNISAKVASVSSTPSGSDASALAGKMGGNVPSGGGSSMAKYLVRVLIDKPDERLKIGMTANTELSIEKRDNVLTVPITAISTDGDSSFVWHVTLDGSGQIATEEKVPVKVVTSNSTVSVIEGSGLVEGDLVKDSAGDSGSSKGPAPDNM